MGKIDKFIHFCDKAMFLSFCALIYFVPISIAFTEIFTSLALLFYLLKRGASHGITPPISPSTSAKNGIQSFFVKIVCWIKSFKPRDNYLNKPIAMYILINLFSILVSQHTAVSIEGFFGKVLQGTFVFFTFIECINSLKRLKTFLIIYVISLVVVCVNGIYQYFTFEGFIFGHVMNDGRVLSCFRQPNDFGAYLLLIIPVLICFTFFIQKKDDRTIKDVTFFSSLYTGNKRIILIVLLLLSAGCFLLTYSRGAWIGMVGAFFLSKKYYEKTARTSLFLMLTVVLIFGPLLCKARYSATDLRAWYQKLQTLSIDEIKSDELRHVAEQIQKEEQMRLESVFQELEEERRKAAEEKAMGREAPFSYETLIIPRSLTFKERCFRVREKARKGLSQGYWEIRSIVRSTYHKLINTNNRLVYWRSALTIIRDHPIFGVGVNSYSLVSRDYQFAWGGYPHNCYLQMMAETGIFGLLSFLFIFIILLRNSLHAFNQIKFPSLQLLLLGFLIGLFGFLVHGFFDTIFYSVQLNSLMWMIMGVIMSIQLLDGGGGK